MAGRRAEPANGERRPAVKIIVSVRISPGVSRNKHGLEASAPVCNALAARVIHFCWRSLHHPGIRPYRKMKQYQSLYEATIK